MSADQLKVSIGTFNVGTQPPGSIKVDHWLHIQRDDPDILVVGIEEADASNMSFVVWSPVVEDNWCAAIESAMGSKVSQYKKLSSKQLVGTMILVYIRKQISSRITSLASSSVGIGIGGYLANKGAVSVRFELDGKYSTCFVVSHLSAFEGGEARERRRWDYTEIVKRLRFTIVEGEAIWSNSEPGERPGKEFVRDAEAMLRAQLHHDAQWNADARKDPSLDVPTKQLSIIDHDVVFWAGDLNWRLELGIDEVKRLIQQEQYDVLFKYDQLHSEMQAKACFQNFQEQKITFAPTYKYDRGTERYDTSEKKRIPSWTDRILWKQSAGLVHPLHYESCPSISISDHKPVSASFMLSPSK